ncbi:MAG: Unknown protein [uncultured Campylobacterales bacterium]|uniref:Uncharacterized protein n=1 Tax=uncultured Campylobacterales bacterium TaxID=352960 RepID=A0A6S6TDY6_9BACT|nr:MAG: Unknown protein [uncultured Campylobacterales bacterium]
MKKMSLFVVAIFVLLGISGCGSMYNYTVDPTPIKKDSAKYVLKKFDLNLQHGHGQNINNKTFKSEADLRKSFIEFVNLELKEQGLLGAKNSFKVAIDMDYTRNYNYGGNALNKPEFFYTVSVYSVQNKLLANFSIPKSTTTYGTFKDLAISTEIAIFKWDAEDEPKDIAMIAKTLVRELSKLGK